MRNKRSQRQQLRNQTLALFLFSCFITVGSTDKKATFDAQSMICTFQGRLITEHDEGKKGERVALVLNQRTNLETKVELTGQGVSDIAENRGLRAEIEVEIREDILGRVTWGKFRKLKRVLDPYEDTEEYVTSKAVREVCRKKK